MPGCVQTMVTQGMGYADPLINRAKPIITQGRQNYKLVEDVCAFGEKKLEEVVPPLIKKADETIDALPPTNEVITKIKDTISEAPEMIQNTESVKKCTSFITETVEPTCHSVLDKLLDEDKTKKATVWERVKTIPCVAYALFLTYAQVAYTKTQEYAALAWAQMLVWFQWAVDTLSVQIVKPLLEIESVKYYKEQVCTTGTHFCAEYKVWIPKKIDEAGARAKTLYAVGVAKLGEARGFAIEKGVPVEKVEDLAATGKSYVAQGVKMLPTRLTDTLQELPVVGRVWVTFVSLLGDDFKDADSDKFVSPVSYGNKSNGSPTKMSPSKKQM